MRPRVYTCVVPWVNPEQFHKVYAALYSPDITSKRWAVDQISIWETRCHPSLPTAIEATFVIVRAIIQDILFENNVTLCQERDIQMIYSMALVRFINLTVELDQNAKNKISMSAIADRRDIPSWIVDLRHEATHSYCPSLPLLRMGAEAALQYLDKTFWKIEASNLQTWVRVPEDNEHHMAFIISRFQLLQFDELQNNLTEPQKLELKTVWDQIRLFVKKYRKKFIEVFVRSGLFITSKDELVEMLKSSESSFIDNEDVYELPVSLEKFWKPVIFILQRYDLLSDFIEILLHTQMDRDPLGQKLAISWILKLLQTTLYSAPQSSELSKLFRKRGTLYNWKRLLYACLKYPVHCTKAILPLILTYAEVTQKWSLEFTHLLAIFQGEVLNDKDLEEQTVYIFTLEDLKKRLELEANEKRKREELPEEENIWSYASNEIEFHKIPIGAVMNALQVDATDGELSNDLSMSDEESVDEQYIFGNENDNEEIEEILITNDSATLTEDQRTASPATDMVYQREDL